ncbi:MAG TPA: serine hydrolase, partial [Prolixibacteraceae bacterium]|nr:serine hydrolase [Prolixibacteraceae bacterium]
PTGSFSKSKDSLFFTTLVNEIIKGHYGRINSILFSKDNKLIGEEYFYNYSANTQHQIESSSKSVTSLLIGIAIDKGFILDVNQPLFEIFPEYKHLKKGNYRKITIKHVLTMTPGFENTDKQFADKSDRIGFALQRKMVNTPGRIFSYDGGNTEILGAILHRKTGMIPDEFAKKSLLDPLKIENYQWERMDDDFPLMSGSLKLIPRDFMKIGLLVLNKGMYDGKRIVSENWIKESTSPKIESHIDDDLYAYQWWNRTFETEKNEYNVIWANGWGSQFIFVIPKLNMVITTTGYNYEFDSWSITKGIENNLSLLE